MYPYIISINSDYSRTIEFGSEKLIWVNEQIDCIQESGWLSVLGIMHK